MQRKILLPALFFVSLAVGIFLLGKTPFGESIRGVLQYLFLPLQRSFMMPFLLKTDKDQEEFFKVLQTYMDQYQLVQENKALRDQFEAAISSSVKLSPATIVGAPGFVPNVSLPEYFIIDKGKQSKVRVGQAVVFKDMLVGKIVTTSEYLSKVQLTTNIASSFTVKTLPFKKETPEALGIVRGIGNGELLLDNVLLSDMLTIGDMVVTKGDISEKGIGYPANLVVGKIVSVDKKSSELFQSARIRNLIDFSKLSVVFLFMGYE